MMMMMVVVIVGLVVMKLAVMVVMIMLTVMMMIMTIVTEMMTEDRSMHSAQDCNAQKEYAKCVLNPLDLEDEVDSLLVHSDDGFIGVSVADELESRSNICQGDYAGTPQRRGYDQGPLGPHAGDAGTPQQRTQDSG